MKKLAGDHPVALNEPGETILLMGNEAIARGAIEAGVQVATAYPGTPSSEIIGTLGRVGTQLGIHVEWSTNEKVALDVAAGAAQCGVRSLTAMKYAGVNVAADMLLNGVNLMEVKGGLVVVSADDPQMHSSASEQDTRWLARDASIPCIEPKDPQEAKDFMKYAFKISEEFRIPVMFRTVTRVSHTRGNVVIGEIPKEKRKGEFDFEKLSIRKGHPILTVMLMKKMHGKIDKIREKFESFEGNELKLDGTEKIGLIASGLSFNYAMEAVEKLGVKDKIAYLKLATTYPLPTGLISKLLSSVKELMIVEELEPWVELHVKALAKDVNPDAKIYGKESKHIPREGELNTPIVANAIADVINVERPYKARPLAAEAKKRIFPRMLALCSGCPHRATTYALKEAVKKVTGDYFGAIVNGDIGCYTLSMIPPLSLIDTLFCMGTSVGAASGQSHSGSEKIPIAMIGDSTFFHAGIPGLINAVYNKANIKVVICDNLATAMTGFQPYAGTGVTATGEKGVRVAMEDIVKACGVDYVKVIDPYDLKGTMDTMLEALEQEGVAVVISRRLCAIESVRRMRRKGEKPTPYEVDPAVCTGYKICVGRFGCPAMSWKAEEEIVEINPDLCTGCGVCAQICPVGAISQAKEG